MRKNILAITGLIAATATAGIIAVNVDNKQEVQKTPPPPPVSHHIDVQGNYPNGYWNYPCQPGDTLFLHGTFTYMAFGNVSGASGNKIVIDAKEATFKWNGVKGQGVGFNFSDCNWFKIMNANIHNSFTGTAISIGGKSNHFELGNNIVDSAVYAVWFKDEPQDHPCDSSYWFGHNIMTDFYMHDCKFLNINQDVCYIGSTDQKADRNLSCNGVTYHPLPAQVKDIRIARIYIRHANRSGIQVSGGINVYVDSCNIADMGNEQNPNQGTGISIGGNTFNAEVGWDTIKSTYNYNIYCQGYGNLRIHDNITDSAGYSYLYKNSQQMPSVNVSSYRIGTTWKLYNNRLGLNTAKPFTNVAAYATTSHMTDTGNYFRCTGVFYNLGQTFNYDTVCTGSGHTDTTFKTVSITHDSLIRVITKDSSKVVDSTRDVATRQFNDGHKKGGYVTTQKVFFHYAYIYDTVNKIISTTHDTTYIFINNVKLGYGVFILNTGQQTYAERIHIAKDTGCTWYRDNYTFGTTYRSKQVADSGLFPIVTFAFSENQIHTGSPVYFPKDTAAARITFENALNTYSPPVACFINEMINYEYWTPVMKDYGDLYSVFIDVCHKHGVKVADGGFTFPDIFYSYFNYLQTHGMTTELNALITASGIADISGPFAQQKLHQSDSLMDIIHDSKSDYANVHWYEPIRQDTSIYVLSGLLPTLSNYLAMRTGKIIITNEFGTRNFYKPLLDDVCNSLKALGMPIQCYFAGDNSSLAINLIDQYSSYIKAQ
jgi:hypothetical protein